MSVCSLAAAVPLSVKDAVTNELECAMHCSAS